MPESTPRDVSVNTERIAQRQIQQARRLQGRQDGSEYRNIGNRAIEIFTAGAVVFGTVMDQIILTGEASLRNPSFFVAAGGMALFVSSAIAFRRWGISQAENPTTISISKS
jgi:hypothetical protein